MVGYKCVLRFARCPVSVIGTIARYHEVKGLLYSIVFPMYFGIERSALAGDRDTVRFGIAMHELSATQALIDLAVAECARRGIRKPQRLVAELGQLSSYEVDPIKFFFEVAREEIPILVDSELEIIRIKPRVLCRLCKQESIIEGPMVLRCLHCAADQVEVVAGRDFYLTQIVFDEDQG